MPKQTSLPRTGSPTNDLHLNRFAFYIRRQAALKWAAWGLTGGLGIAVLLNIIAWTFPILTHAPRIVLSMGVAALVMLLTFFASYLYPRSQTTIARLSDTRLGLQARLATALEIQAGQLPVPPDIAVRQWSDACAAAEKANPRQALAPRFPHRQALIAAMLLVILIVGFVMPNPQETLIVQRRIEQQAIEKQIERLEKLRDEIEANENLSQEDKEALLREINDTLRDLQEGAKGPHPSLTRKKAVARLSETEDKLKELADKVRPLDEDVNTTEAALKKVGREAAQGENTQANQFAKIGHTLQQSDYEGAAQAIESLSESLDQMSKANQFVPQTSSPKSRPRRKDWKPWPTPPLSPTPSEPVCHSPRHCAKRPQRCAVAT